jgi:hypothetical protein
MNPEAREVRPRRGDRKVLEARCTQHGGSQASEKTFRGDDCVAGHIGFEL